MRKQAFRGAIATVLTVAGAAAAPMSASAAAGNVLCVGGGNVVGVWVNLAGGGGGWAGRSGSGASQRWWFDNRGRRYSLTVGCGGSPARWGSSSSTTYYAYWGDITCFPGYIYGGSTPAVANTCR